MRGVFHFCISIVHFKAAKLLHVYVTLVYVSNARRLLFYKLSYILCERDT